jgi:protein O-mannosyl-transferase
MVSARQIGKLGPKDAHLASRSALLAPGLIALICVAAYANSFWGPFIFDDSTSIQTNPFVRHLWPLWKAMQGPKETTVAGRPSISLSLAANYAISGLEEWSYHALNLFIHMSCAWLVFGIVKRTLLSKLLAARFGSNAWGLALAIAAIWAAHPLNTMCVTYIIQRAESLMGLCYLLTLYCVICSYDSARPAGWQIGAVLACLAGMGSKEVMATAPIVVLVYDALFLADGFAATLRRRGWMYGGLCACWILLGALVASGPRTQSTGLSMGGITPWAYLSTQPQILLYYVKLVFWPWPLCLDYEWPIALSWIEIALPGLLVLSAVGATAWALVERRPGSFLGVWFFGVLSVTSSVVPIVILASEHRMYLPSISLISGATLLVWSAARKFSPLSAVQTNGTLAVAATCVIVLLTGLTIRRNCDYWSPIGMWQQVAELRPENPRAWASIGILLDEAGKYDDALAPLKRSVEVDRNFPDARYGYAIALANCGRLDEALQEFQAGVNLRPHDKRAEYNLGSSFARQGRLLDAISHYRKAVEIDADYSLARGKLGLALAMSGQTQEAVRELRRATEFQPDLASELNALAWTLATDADPQLRNGDEAVAAAKKAVGLDNTGHAAFLDTQAAAYAEDGRFAEAIATGEKAFAAAEAGDQQKLAEAIRKRIALYRIGQPYRSP